MKKVLYIIVIFFALIETVKAGSCPTAGSPTYTLYSNSAWNSNTNKSESYSNNGEDTARYGFKSII